MIHFMLCIYTMLMIGVVIDEYFVPSLEIIAEGICCFLIIKKPNKQKCSLK